jgi:hypothetical protein
LKKILKSFLLNVVVPFDTFVNYYCTTRNKPRCEFKSKFIFHMCTSVKNF